MSNAFSFRVPATSANLGPAFGVAGLAVDLFFDCRVEERGVGSITVERPQDSEPKELDARHDSVVRGMRGAAERMGIELPDGLAVVIRGDVPRACGLGSNTAEFVIGLRAAVHYAEETPSHDELLSLLIELGGDPAHGAAALRGGLSAAIPGGEPGLWRCLKLPLAAVWHCGIASPDMLIGTADMHRVVPASVPNAIAQRTAGRVVGLLSALATGDEQLLVPCLQDEVHVPYRLQLAPGMSAAMEAARAAGAPAVTISGHGPSVIALTTDEERAEAAAEAMKAAFEAEDTEARAMHCRPFPGTA